MRFTKYLSDLIQTSKAVAKQFVPSPEEYASIGTETPFEEGKHSTGIMGWRDFIEIEYS